MAFFPFAAYLARRTAPCSLFFLLCGARMTSNKIGDNPLGIGGVCGS